MALLVIVAGLSSLMFFFITGVSTQSTLTPNTGSSKVVGSGYGESIERIALEYYTTDYATSALQTLLYSSTPRKTDETLATSKEIDYLLAFLKEDFAIDESFGESSKMLTMKDLNLVMSSSLSNYDYLFLMYIIPGESGMVNIPVLVILKYTDFDFETGVSDRIYYFCDPGPGGATIIEEELFGSIGSVVKAQPVLLRFSTIEKKKYKIFTSINMWPIMSLPKEDLIEKPDKLNCVRAFPE